jgi:hypothetical protein
MAGTLGGNTRIALIATLLFACLLPVHVGADAPALSSQDEAVINRAFVGLVQQGYKAPDVARLLAKARECAKGVSLTSGLGLIIVGACLEPVRAQVGISEDAIQVATTNVGNWNFSRGECTPMAPIKCRTNETGRLRVDISGKGQDGFATGTATVDGDATTTYTFYPSDDPLAYDFIYTLRGYPEYGYGYVYWTDQCHMNGVFFSETERDDNGNRISGTIVMLRCRL